MTDLAPRRPPREPEEPRWQTYGCLALLLVGLYLVLGPKIVLSQWMVTPDGNAAMDEALQWQKGELSLSHRYYESAESGGRYYSVAGLAFTLLAAAMVSLTELLSAEPAAAGTGAAALGLSTAQYIALVALPLPLVAFWAFRAVSRSAPWAAVMAAALIAGTSLAHVLAICRTGSIYYINHVLAVIGLLILGAELLGRKRVLPAVIGLVLAAWSRQMTLLYALPLLWILIWNRHGTAPRVAPATQLPALAQANAPAGDVQPTTPALPRARRRSLVFALASIAIAVGVPMTLNALKFGSPFDTGYKRLYADRTDLIGRRAQAALFGLRYAPMHVRAMNTTYPAWDVRAGTLYADVSDTNGGSIWLTSPLLLGVFMTIRRWWADPARRALMLGTLPVIAGLWCYHTTGADRAGCYRYALDFIPLWLLVISPFCRGPRGLPLTLGCLAYSALYFRLLP